MPANRQLAAILFTDIEGFTALMQRDEQKAIAMKDRHRDIFQKTHQQYNGRILRYYGDGTLSIFQSAVDAVKCAVAMQQAYVQSPQIPVRMGLHVGDITIEDEDIFGDGVNLSSRIESLGVVGSVLVSDKLNDEIRNHPEIKTVSAGIYNLKNVERSVEVFAIASEGLVIPKLNSLRGKTGERKTSVAKRKRKLSVRTVIIAVIALIVLATGSYFLVGGVNKKENAAPNNWLAVLPFRLISSDSSMEWLSDGFTVELTNAISGISDLRVKSSTTMIQYKNSTKTVRQIGEELNVSNIIEGNIQMQGDTIIFNAQMINPETDEILKNFPFRKNATEIRFIYSQVAQEVADILNVSLKSGEKKRLQQTTKVDPQAYNLYLQGDFLIRKITYDGSVEAIKLFDQVLEKDSNYAPALVGKAWGYFHLGWFKDISTQKAVQELSRLLNKAIAIDSNLSLAYTIYGWGKILEWDLIGAEKKFIKAYDLDHSDDIGISGLVLVYTWWGKIKEAQRWWENGKAISPNSMWIDATRGNILYFQDKIPEAIKFQQLCISKYDHILFYHTLGWIYNLNGQNKEAINVLETGLSKFNFRYPPSLASLSVSYYKNGDKMKAQEIFSEMEQMVSEGKQNVAVYLASAYAFIGEKTKALDMLDKAYKLKDIDMVWLKQDLHFKLLHNEPRYKEMLKKVGFN